VVLTSSDAAVTAGSAARATAFSEKDWTNLEQASAYEKSKTLAERAAWDWVQAKQTQGVPAWKQRQCLGALE
jgi:nucleoside-diphosphate-sugar epimerase